MKSRQIKLPKKQQGAALVVCLIVLLVMTIIGVTSVSNSTIQQRMAFNLRQQQLAENAAEAALRAAEDQLEAQIVSLGSIANFDNGAGRYISRRDNELQIALAEHDLTDLTDPASWTAANSVEVTDLSEDAVGTNNPRYIIEYIGRADPPNIGRASQISSLSGNPPEYIHFAFRITAIGWGVDPNAYAVLQSTFRSQDFIVSQ
ncbi:pilus assembly protein [Porticoccus sp. W117]|uniref:pilus assembly PilX family protein n=1 Tax=Porticoccus sp. W117 TaxID=3054777 RepID=UPI0025929B5A|nr:pilus assembly protein [Porticoccus sp. W117]MDM3871259.1 pilus assembly protein [Porticoccus sp. W117]